MRDVRLVVDSSGTPGLSAQLADALGEHAQAVVGDSGFHPVAVFARDRQESLVGGVTATVNWTWLSIKLLWVSETYRERGLGRRLMETIEALGRDRGCTHAHVDTLGFQAPDFYRRLGYEPFAKLPDYAAGHPRIYLKKQL